MKKLKIKIICGFAEDQKYTIDIEEAHKAYYLFRNPEQRGVFENGIALIGKNIQAIQPDWHAIMDWNPTHKLDSDDWNEIDGSGVKQEVTKLLQQADDIALEIVQQPGLVLMPLSQVLALPEFAKPNELKSGASDLVEGLVAGMKE